MPIRLQSAYPDLVYSAVMFPHTKTAAREMLSLSMLSDLLSEQQGRISGVILSGWRNDGT